MHSEKHVVAAGDAGRQPHQGAGPLSAGIRTVPPPLKLPQVHTQARGQALPGQAGGLLEGFQARPEVFWRRRVAEEQTARGHGTEPLWTVGSTTFELWLGDR